MTDRAIESAVEESGVVQTVATAPPSAAANVLNPLGFASRSQTGAEFAREDAAAYDVLRTIIATGNAIAFVGAGVSVPAGLPTWYGLLGKLRDKAMEYDPTFTDPVPEAKDWLVYADTIRDRLRAAGPDVLADTFGRMFQRLPEIMEAPRYSYLRPLHRALVRLPFAGWTTTNYDHVLEHAIADEYWDPDRGAPEPKAVCIFNGNVPDLSDAIRGMTAPTSLRAGPRYPRTVVHWHGTYGSASTIVLGARDYAEAYGFWDLVPPTAGAVQARPPARGVSRLFTAMAALLMTRQIVFWGFSLEDPYVVHVLSRAADLLWDWGRTVHIAILPLHVGDAMEERRQRDLAAERLDGLGVRTLWFPVVDNDFSALEIVVERLARDTAFGEAGSGRSDAAGSTRSAVAGTLGTLSSAEGVAAVRPGPTPATPPEWLRRATLQFEQKGPRDED